MGTSSSFLKAIIGMEIMSFVISLILLLGNKLENKRQSKRSRWFDILVLFEMIGCFSDAVSWILDGHSEFGAVLYITTTCSMIVTLILMGCFISYFSAYMREKRAISNIPAIIGWAFVTSSVIATIIASATGNLFTFESGAFISKPLYSVYTVMNMLGMIIGLIFVSAYRKVLNWYDKLAAYSYMLFPMLATAFGLLFDGFEFAYPTVAVTLLILYIILQSDRVEKLEQEGMITSYKATHDELTGLNNRSEYRERIQMLKSVNENSGVIFSDLNGLKYTNDTFGHEAGDRLLVRYAQLLTDIFRRSDVYRISGDEFICILENMPEETFKERMYELKNAMKKEDPPLACIGADYGRNQDIDMLIKNAENNMYTEKKVIHERYPIIKR